MANLLEKRPRFVTVIRPCEFFGEPTSVLMHPLRDTQHLNVPLVGPIRRAVREPARGPLVQAPVQVQVVYPAKPKKKQASKTEDVVVLQKEVRNLQKTLDAFRCKICLVENAQILFSPCNHVVSCRGCTEILRNDARNLAPAHVNADHAPLDHPRCPLCRVPATQLIRVFPG